MESFKSYLDSTAFVPKLVCGAGNENAKEVERLVYLYSMAGFQYFDLSAKAEIVEAAQRGLELSGKEGYLNISMGIPGDPHADKAEIDPMHCINCGECRKACPNAAIDDSSFGMYVRKNRCVGCGRCVKVCPTDAIRTYTIAKPIKDVIPPLINRYSIASVELHMVGDMDEGMQQWKDLNMYYNGVLSLCIDRSILGDRDLIDRIKWCIKDREPYTTIIQADGCPMSGDDKASTTLQAIAIAQIVDRAKLPVYIMISGGTNQYTKKYLEEFRIPHKGIAWGTYARQLVRDIDDSIAIGQIHSNLHKGD